jgi:hypothetical protein
LRYANQGKASKNGHGICKSAVESFAIAKNFNSVNGFLQNLTNIKKAYMDYNNPVIAVL